MSYTQNSRVLRTLELISTPSGFTVDKIMDQLIQEDYKLSKRTLERDIARFRDLFDIHIEYNKREKRYYVVELNESRANMISRIKEHTIQAELLSISNQKEFQNFIEFERSLAGPNVDIFRMAASAIHKNKILEISYQKYGSKTSKTYKVEPRLLKEYEHRWYLITTQKGKKTPIVFSMDSNRLLSAKILSETFKPVMSMEKIQERFQAIIGVYYPEDLEQEVLLALTETEAGYLESQPWHTSQKFIKQEAGEWYYSFFLVPNIELVKKILTASPAIRVIKPDPLKLRIEEILHSSLELYKS